VSSNLGCRFSPALSPLCGFKPWQISILELPLNQALDLCGADKLVGLAYHGLMCASYMIRQRNPGQIGIPVDMRIDIEEYYDRLILPYGKAPILVNDGGDLPILTSMKFSMVPSWSKEPKVKFATHNARLETIDEKPTWKKVFVQRHCLIPLTDFIEPIYEGELAGFMVAFANPSGQMLFAAGVWDEWVNKETGEVVQSFAIITHEPPPFIASIGHDRCPVFLDAESGAKWLDNVQLESEALKNFLLQRQLVPELMASKHRPMKAGWEKRK
jgi:putative SOS response-associated peptidase YedK